MTENDFYSDVVLVILPISAFTYNFLIFFIALILGDKKLGIFLIMPSKQVTCINLVSPEYDAASVTSYVSIHLFLCAYWNVA